MNIWKIYLCWLAPLCHCKDAADFVVNSGDSTYIDYIQCIMPAGQASVSEQQSKQPLAAAVGRVLNNAKVVFQVSRDNLPQSLEWLNGIYVPIRWSNVLHPAWHINLSVPAAVKAVTAAPVAPETCINI